ncbi:MAG: hypothetical protein VZQ47_06935 [Treponema sp.]|nr:hypothetical protein [Treponema sp.]
MKKNDKKGEKNAPSCGCVIAEPLDNCATRCLRLKLFYFAAYAAAQTESFRKPPRDFRVFFAFLVNLQCFYYF